MTVGDVMMALKWIWRCRCGRKCGTLVTYGNGTRKVKFPLPRIVQTFSPHWSITLWNVRPLHT